MNPFIYEIPTKVYFVENQLQHLGTELKQFGNRVLLVYGGGSIKRNGVYDTVISQAKEVGMEVFELSGVEPNPRVDTVRKGVRLCKDNNIDVVLAVDSETGKPIRILNHEEVLSRWEDYKQGMRKKYEFLQDKQIRGNMEDFLNIVGKQIANESVLLAELQLKLPFVRMLWME